MSKKLFYTIIFFLYLTKIFSQNIDNQIFGIISDENEIPLPYANILIKGTTQGQTTNEKGQYRFQNLAVGQYSLVVSMIGYQSKTIPITITSNQKKYQLDVQLQENAVSLDGVTVNAESESSEKKKLPFAVLVIDTKELQTQSIQLNNVLNQTVGVKVQQDGGLGARVSYNINGLTGNAIRIFLDGVPMEYFGSTYSMNSIPISLVDRIDVYKGVVPVDLGNDALGGAVNVVTKKQFGNILDLAYSVGSFNTHQFSVNGNTRATNSGLTFRFSGFYNYSDNNYKVWGDNIFVANDDISNPNFGTITRGIKAERFHDKYRLYGAKADIGFTDTKWADQFLISFLHSDMKKDLQHGSTMSIPFGERRVEEDMWMPHLTYSKEDFIFNNLNINIFSAYIQQNRQLIDTTSNQYNWYGKIINEPFQVRGEASSNPTLAHNEEETFLNRINLTYKFNDNNKLGINYIYSDFKREGDDPLADPSVRSLGDVRQMKKQVTGFSYENKSFQQKLQTVLFLKLYQVQVDVVNSIYEAPNYVPFYFDRNDKNIGYGIGLSYQLTDGLKITASAEKAVRFAEPNEIFGNGAENIEPAFNLKPEKSENFNLGLSNTFNIAQHTFRISPTVFYRNSTDLLQQVSVDFVGTNGEAFRYENLSKTFSTGLDLELHYDFKNQFQLAGNVSFLNARFNNKYDENGEKYDHYQARLQNMPYFQYHLGARYTKLNLIQKNAKFLVYWNLNYVHEFYRRWETYATQGKDIIPNQLVNDLGIGYTFPNKQVTLSFDIQNIFNEQVFDNFAIQKPGRAFYVKGTFHLGQ